MKFSTKQMALDSFRELDSSNIWLQALVEELLRACGNNVYRSGYESLLQNLIQSDANFDRGTKNGQQIRSIPDFVVVNSRGRATFVEVKFRRDPDQLDAYLL